jgi:Ca2+-binding EF-hand superfamily protein
MDENAKIDCSDVNKMNSVDFNFIQKNTNLNLSSIKDFYAKFLQKYSNGCVNREEFNSVLKSLIVNNKDEDENERLLMSNRLFDICDQDEDGYIDFKVNI